MSSRSRHGVNTVTQAERSEGPLRVRRVDFVMSALCPVCTQHQTFSEPNGTSHLGQERTSENQRSTSACLPATGIAPEAANATRRHSLWNVGGISLDINSRMSKKYFLCQYHQKHVWTICHTNELLGNFEWSNFFTPTELYTFLKTPMHSA